ncbi:SAM-dependent methyltransferase [Rugosimonospora acidiphila]
MDTVGQVGQAEQGRQRKPATAARMYDYYLGGVHNFPADREAAERIIAQFPLFPAVARENRAFLHRVVRHLAGAGVRQFLDIGSGIPTVGNVHEIVQAEVPDARVVYVDIDPVAVAESLEILEGNDLAIAIRADLCDPQRILEHPQVRELLDFEQPIALLLAAVLHFVPDDAKAYEVVGRLVDALPPGSYLAISAAAAESFAPSGAQTQAVIDVYRQRTTTSAASRTKSKMVRFFAGLELVAPGVVWLYQWPDPERALPDPFGGDATRCGEWAGLGRKE